MIISAVILTKEGKMGVGPAHVIARMDMGISGLGVRAPFEGYINESGMLFNRYDVHSEIEKTGQFYSGPHKVESDGFDRDKDFDIPKAQGLADEFNKALATFGENYQIPDFFLYGYNQGIANGLTITEAVKGAPAIAKVKSDEVAQQRVIEEAATTKEKEANDARRALAEANQKNIMDEAQKRRDEKTAEKQKRIDEQKANADAIRSARAAKRGVLPPK